MSGREIREATWWHRERELVICDLCPHGCRLSPGATGLCGVRRSDGSRLLSLNDGFSASVAVDPIEKKPLYHYRPGSDILSLGTVGCNLRCPFCQNWEIARWDPGVRLFPLDAEDVVRLASEKDIPAVAFTYNEPLIWYEFVLRTSRLLKEKKFDVVLVSNGTICPEPLRELLPFVDAANIDVKAFSPEIYSGVLGGDLETTKHTVSCMASHGVHVEITFLLVPGMNDDEEAFRALVAWLASISSDIPLHISRSFPRYKWRGESPTPGLLRRYRDLALEFLRFVYVGNMPDPEVTACPKCGRDIVVRYGYNISTYRLDSAGACAFCGTQTGIVPPRKKP